jgi:hypothetical protein
MIVRGYNKKLTRHYQRENDIPALGKLPVTSIPDATGSFLFAHRQRSELSNERQSVADAMPSGKGSANFSFVCPLSDEQRKNSMPSDSTGAAHSPAGSGSIWRTTPRKIGGIENKNLTNNYQLFVRAENSLIEHLEAKDMIPQNSFLSTLEQGDRSTAYQIFLSAAEADICAEPVEIIEAVTADLRRQRTPQAARILTAIRQSQGVALNFAAGILHSLSMVGVQSFGMAVAA